MWTDLGERVPPIFLQKNISDHVESPTFFLVGDDSS